MDKTVSFKVPAWTVNLIPNLLGLAGLSAICVMVAFLTDWRWGGLLGGVFATVLAGWMQWSTPAQGNVVQLKKAA